MRNFAFETMPGLALSAFPLAFRLINFSQKQAFGGESA
jgi:hypothetical protein